jgi:GAF domain-containing protein
MESAGTGTAGDDGDDLTFVAALRAALSRAAIIPTLAATPADHLLERLVRAATTAIPAPAGSLLLVDPVARVLTFDVVIGQTADKLVDLTLPLGRGIAGLVAASGQPLAIANAQQDPRHARDIAEQSGYLPSTILAVPVTDAEGAVIGVLELLDRQGGDGFSLADMELLGQFAELCALAIAQRRTEAIQAELIGRVLTALSGIPPDPASSLSARLETFAARVAADPAAGRARALAEQVAAIAARGDAEQRACEGVLAVFANYLAEHPEPGTGFDAYGLGAFPKGPR